jgi:hypothetical protein
LGSAFVSIFIPTIRVDYNEYLGDDF